MIRRLGSHIASQWMGAMSLFLVLASGTAYAANTVLSTDIVDGQVKTVDLATAAVSTDNLAAGAVTTEKVKDGALLGRDVLDNTLKGADIDESTLASIGGGGPAGGDLTGTYPNPQIGPDALGGADIDESTLANIGARALKQVFYVADRKLVDGPGFGGVISVNCPPGTLAIGGGGGWEYDSGDVSKVYTNERSTYVAGQNNGGGPQYLSAEVICLPS